MVIYNLDTKERELSCGYTVTLDETPGEWQGQKYDAVQRQIKYNHIAIVKAGRAGPHARLNMDSSQICEDETEDIKPMPKIRLDNSCEYEVPQEVIAAIEQYRKDQADFATKVASFETQATDLQKRLDTTEAERDTLKAEVTKLDTAIKAKDQEHADSLNSKVAERVSLLNIATTHKVEKADSMTDKEIKLAVIKAVRGDGMDLTTKSDEYIAAAFDLCKEDTAQRNDAMSKQRKAVNDKKPDDQRQDEAPKTADEARKNMIAKMKNASKEVK